METTTKPVCKLVGEDGNVFSIIGRMSKTLKRAGLQEQREVRVCDGGDELVFHAKGGRVLFGENFWEEICR